MFLFIKSGICLYKHNSLYFFQFHSWAFPVGIKVFAPSFGQHPLFHATVETCDLSLFRSMLVCARPMLLVRLLNHSSQLVCLGGERVKSCLAALENTVCQKQSSAVYFLIDTCGEVTDYLLNSVEGASRDHVIFSASGSVTLGKPLSFQI